MRNSLGRHACSNIGRRWWGAGTGFDYGARHQAHPRRHRPSTTTNRREKQQEQQTEVVFVHPPQSNWWSNRHEPIIIEHESACQFYQLPLTHIIWMGCTASRTDIITEDPNSLESILSRESLVITDRVGYGSYSDVYAVTRLTDKRKFALKVFHKDSCEFFSTELRTLQALESSHVTAVEASFSPGCILMELCEGGDLCDRIISGGRFNEIDASKFMVHFVENLQHLQDKHVLHLDLKPENIMFKTDSSRPVLIDFNQSHELDAETGLMKKPLSSIVGTYGYTAPEMLMKARNSIVGHAADIFSAGVILYTMLCASYPFTAPTKGETVKRTLSGSSSYIDKPEFKSLSTGAQDLLQGMMRVDQKTRFTLDDIREHPWLKCSVVKFPKLCMRDRTSSLSSSASTTTTEMSLSSPKQPSEVDSPIGEESVACEMSLYVC